MLEDALENVHTTAILKAFDNVFDEDTEGDDVAHGATRDRHCLLRAPLQCQCDVEEESLGGCGRSRSYVGFMHECATVLLALPQQ